MVFRRNDMTHTQKMIADDSIKASESKLNNDTHTDMRDESSFISELVSNPNIVLPTKTKDRMAAIKSAVTAKRRSDKAKSKLQLKAAKQKESLETNAISKYFQDVGDALAEKEKKYHEQYVKNSNAELYKLLEEVMAFTEEVLAEKHVTSIISGMRHTMKHSLRINTQSNTPMVSVVVRYVIRTSRKNACVYARVIERAISEGIKSNGLAQYIIDNQGIDNIRKAAVNAAKTTSDANNIEKLAKNNKEIAAYGISYLQHRVGTGMSKFKLDSKYDSKLIDKSRFTEYKYFACKNISGEFVVIDVVPVDPDFEEVLIRRMMGDLLHQGFFSEEEKKAMKAASEATNLVLTPVH
jgi:hypothetical protein